MNLSENFNIISVMVWFTYAPSSASFEKLLPHTVTESSTWRNAILQNKRSALN